MAPTKRKYKKRPKRTGDSKLNESFVCPNGVCGEVFSSKQGMSNHYLYYSQCHKVSTGSSAFWKQREEETNIAHEEPFPSANSDNDDDGTPFNFDSEYPESDSVGTDLALGLETGSFTNVYAVAKQRGVQHTVSDFVETKLLKILEDANVPHFVYQDILNWGCDANASGYKFEPERTTRKAAIAHIERRFNLEHCRPTQVTIVFPEDDLSIEVTRFDFISQFYSLITDKSLTGDITQLDVNPDDPFARYQSPNGRLGAFNSGKWYSRAHDFLCTPHSNDWLCPIIYACDETLVGSHLGRASVTPLVFTLSIFNESIRNKRTSWRPLGYVYDIAQHGKGMVTNERDIPRKMKPEEKCRRHHIILEKLIESHVLVQQQGGIHGIPIELGTTRKALVNVKVPVGLILGDMQGGDKHCGSVVGYSKNMARLCRQCNIAGDESGDPLVKCKKMSMVKIRQYVLAGDVETLKLISQNNVYSAWFDCDFGGCERGVFSAAMPVEALHAVEGGICKDAAFILFDGDLKDANCRRLDILVRRFCSIDKQHYMTSGSNKAMPRLLFKDRVTSLTKLPSAHVIGILLAVVALSLTDDGKALLQKAFTHGDDVRAGTKRLNDMRYVFSMLLAYWSWLKQETFWECGDRKAQKKAEWAIRKMLSELMQLWPREAGHGWFKPKIHEQLHVPGDITRNGSPRNTYTGPVENNHLDVKAQATRTQMNRTLLDSQIGSRSAEAYIVNYAHDRICNQDNAPPQPNTDEYCGRGLQSSAGNLVLTQATGNRITSVFAWTSARAECPPFPAAVAVCLETAYRGYFGHAGNEHVQCTLVLFTEYKRNGQLFRAHPAYRGGRPWHDWAMFRYEKSGRDVARCKSYMETTHDDEVFNGDPSTIAPNHHYAPGKILCFVQAPDNTLQAVVLCCAFKHVRSGVFTTHWKVEYQDARKTKPYILLMDVEAIVRHCLMIPENEEGHGYHEVWEKERWAKEFV